MSEWNVRAPWETEPPKGLGMDERIEYLLWGEGDKHVRAAPAGAVCWGGSDRPGGGRITRWRRVQAATVNPKDAIGSTKLPLHLWPAEATAVGCLGLLDGKGKYGRDNYVAGDGVIASIYVDACMRHLAAWFAGEHAASDSKIPHLGHALASLAILVKAEAHGKLVDDRSYDPSGAYLKLVRSLTPLVSEVQQAHADKDPKHWTIRDVQE